MEVPSFGCGYSIGRLKLLGDISPSFDSLFRFQDFSHEVYDRISLIKEDYIRRECSIEVLNITPFDLGIWTCQMEEFADDFQRKTIAHGNVSVDEIHHVAFPEKKSSDIYIAVCFALFTAAFYLLLCKIYCFSTRKPGGCYGYYCDAADHARTPTSEDSRSTLESRIIVPLI